MLEVDCARRTIEGRAVPYDVAAYSKQWAPFRFLPDSLVWDEWPPLLIEHNQALRVGKVAAFQQFDWGLWVQLRVSNGPKGDRALEMAVATHRGLSIFVDSIKSRLASDGVHECTFGRIIEVTLTSNPVFK